jgi:threonine dehydratase
MRLLHAHAGLVSEPAGVAGLAAVLASRADFAGRDVATVICGGNLTAEQFAAYDIAPARRG